MIKTIGIIAEYNPFHNGHKALLEMAYQAGYTHSIAVMSGNFVQRATPAISEKRIRTKAALSSGVNLVIELPLPYATASAGYFAAGAIATLKATGAVDALCFGSESGDTEALNEIVNCLESDSFKKHLRLSLDMGAAFAKARTDAIGKVLGEDYADIARLPNNLLAIEYLAAAKKLSWQVEAITFKRCAVEHDSLSPREGFASASYLREWADDLEKISGYIPKSAYEIYKAGTEDDLYSANIKRLEVGIVSYLRRLKREEILTLPDISEGLENRLLKSIEIGTTLEELYKGLKTKRYTLSRVRRIIICAFLGIKASYVSAPPPYIRALGIGKNAESLLAKIDKNANLPFSHSLKELAKTSPMGDIFADLEASATDQYMLCLPKAPKTGYDFYSPSVFIK